MNKRTRIYMLSAIIFIIVLLIGSAGFYTIKHSSDKAKAQAASEALRAQEAKEAEEQKKQEEAQKLVDKKKQDDALKIQQAIKGEGNSKKIPVLMYHSIDFEKGNELRIPKDKFRLQMKYLKDNGFTTLTLNELYSYIVFGTSLPEKPVVLTLDDGYVDNYTNALPVLKEFDLKATVFMITSCIDTDKRYLTSKQLQEMDKAGMDIESHTVTHPELNKLSYDNQLIELKNSKVTLEKILGRDVPYLAYPYGRFNADTLKITQDLGYKMAFSTIIGDASKSDGLYKLHRLYVSNNDNMDRFKNMINSVSK
jgi:peptidoglycan/xylan/chitin deacetylase (PgdA/CDA1 family)